MGLACGFLLLVIVFTDVKGACPEGWTGHGERCYLYLVEHYSWFDAQAACHYAGGMLVEENSEAERQFVEDFIRMHGSNSAWIGINDLVQEGTFVWTSSRQKVQNTFTSLPWYPGEPNNLDNAQDCVISYFGQWRDNNCESGGYASVCETDPESEPQIG